jgi:hypothetical protein
MYQDTNMVPYLQKHIIRLLGYSWKSTRIKIMMPLQKGSLSQLGTLDPVGKRDLLATMLYQMLLALEYLAAKGICHRDVKPDNILYDDKNGQFIFQLADLGLINTAADAMTFCGTPVYTAPELFDDQNSQTPAVDIWSLFVTVASTMGFIDVNALWKLPRLVVTKAILDVAADKLILFQLMAEMNVSKRASAAMMLLQMKKHYPDIVTESATAQNAKPRPAVAEHAAIPPVQAQQAPFPPSLFNGIPVNPVFSQPQDSMVLHRKRLDARQQAAALKPTKPAAPLPAPFHVATATREYIEQRESKGGMIALGNGIGPPTQFIDPKIAKQLDPNVIGPRIQYQHHPYLWYLPIPPAQEQLQWRMVQLGAGGRAFGCKLPGGDPNGLTCHIFCQRPAIPGKTCECHILCHPLCPLATIPRRV